MSRSESEDPRHLFAESEDDTSANEPRLVANQLDLSVLHSPSPSASPMKPEFDYAKELHRWTSKRSSAT